jgi:hypothetical protein
LCDAVLADTFESSVKTYNKIRAIKYVLIKCVLWASVHVGAFYISERNLKNFFPDPDIRIVPFGLLNERENKNPSGNRQDGKEVNSNEEIFFL